MLCTSLQSSVDIEKAMSTWMDRSSRHNVATKITQFVSLAEQKHNKCNTVKPGSHRVNGKQNQVGSYGSELGTVIQICCEDGRILFKSVSI